MIRRSLVLTICILALLAATALAQTNQKAAKPARDFNTADVNKDGKVTLDELRAHTGMSEDKAKAVIKKYDRDNLGYLRQKEFDAWKAEESYGGSSLDQ